MDPLFLLNLVVRYAHVGGAVLLVGALLWSQLNARAIERRHASLLSLGALVVLVSGAYQFMTHMAGAPPLWHAVAGIKVLLALHVITVALLLGKGGQDEAKRRRLTTGALYSGWVVILLGSFLHTLK